MKISRFTNPLSNIYEQRMLQNAIKTGVKQYLMFENPSNILGRKKDIAIKVVEVPPPKNKYWIKELEEIGFTKNTLSFVNFLGMSFHLPQMVFSSILIHVADMVKAGSTIVLDYAETKSEGVSSYSYLEMATMLNFAGFDIYEYISPSDWAESWNDSESVDKTEFDGVILAVKRAI